MIRWLLALGIAVALAATACGDGDETTAAPGGTPAAVEPSPTPGPGDDRLLVGGVAYVPAGETVRLSRDELEPVGEDVVPDREVYRRPGDPKPWLRYVPADGAYRILRPAVVDLAVGDLAADLGVEPGAITVVAAEPVEWPDACLGVQRPDVACAEVITPGFRIVLEHAGDTYVYHADRRERVVRAEPREG